MDELSLDKYQQLAAFTAVYPEDFNTLYPILGLAGEAGELANKTKKVLRGDYVNLDYDQIREALIEELGDCMWYIALIARDLKVDLSEVAQLNLDKLAGRSKRGVIKGEGDKR